MKSDVIASGHLVQDTAQDMLARMLLHQIEPPRPVDASVGRAPFFQRCGKGMPDLAVTLVHLKHLFSAERSGVIGLSAALRIKSGRVQTNKKLSIFFPPLEYLCGKFSHIRILIVEF